MNPEAQHRPFMVVRAYVDPQMLDEFEAWCAQDYFPQVLRIPGIVSGRRGYPSSGTPNYFSIFKFQDESVIQSALSSPEASAARESWERWMPHLRDLSVEIYISLVPMPIFFRRN